MVLTHHDRPLSCVEQLEEEERIREKQEAEEAIRETMRQKEEKEAKFKKGKPMRGREPSKDEIRHQTSKEKAQAKVQEKRKKVTIPLITSVRWLSSVFCPTVKQNL